MRPKKCVVQNFGSYADAEISFDNLGLTLISGPTGSGKCFAKGTPVLMYSGQIKRVEDIRPGDLVMGPDSEPRVVQELSSGMDRMYEVSTSIGTKYVVNSSHVLALQFNTNCGRYKKGDKVNIPILQYLKSGVEFRRLARGYTARIDKFERAAILKVEPYFLGLWLGDGSSEATAITTADPEVSGYITEVAAKRDLRVLTHHKGGSNKASTYVITSKEIRYNTLFADMLDYGLIGNKHIPHQYLTASREVRLEVLAGLIDSDGYLCKPPPKKATNRPSFAYEYVAKSKDLAMDVVYLAKSLGFRVTFSLRSKYVVYKHCKRYGDYYVIRIAGNVQDVPSRLPRKRVPTDQRTQQNPLHHSLSIAEVGIGEYFGFSVDKDHLFVLGDFTVAHNSTITDFVSWACFGITSKNGASDDVRAWGCDEPTRVTLDVELPDGEIQIVRTRGKPIQNDLYFTEASNPEKEIRGKDAPETQRLLSQRLGVDAELYLLASAFTQFSDTDRFFTCKAKERREVLERITDLSLPVTLAVAASEARKVAKKELETIEVSISKETGRQEQLLSQKASAERASATWETQQAQALADAQAKSTSFDDDKTAKITAMAEKIEATAATVKPDEYFDTEIAKVLLKQEKLTGVRAKHQKLVAKVADLSAKIEFALKEQAKQKKMPDVCPECSRPGANPHREEHVARLEDEINTLHAEQLEAETALTASQKTLDGEYALTKALNDLQRERAENQRRTDRMEADEQALIALDAQENPYLHRLEQLAQTKNPYKGQVAEAVKAAAAMDGTLKGLEKDRADKEHRVVSLSSIYDLSFALRGELLQSAVSQLERETNSRLEEFFDSAFRVRFTLEDSDKLEVEIYKDEFVAPFKSLSGGQRRLLVIAFSTALMQLAADTAGVTFGLMVFDEVLQGLDPDLKIKAFRLFEALSERVDSVLFVEHDESFKNCFQHVIQVSIDEGGKSMISLEREGIPEAA